MPRTRLAVAPIRARARSGATRSSKRSSQRVAAGCRPCLASGGPTRGIGKEAIGHCHATVARRLAHVTGILCAAGERADFAATSSRSLRAWQCATAQCLAMGAQRWAGGTVDGRVSAAHVGMGCHGTRRGAGRQWVALYRREASLGSRRCRPNR